MLGWRELGFGNTEACGLKSGLSHLVSPWSLPKEEGAATGALGVGPIFHHVAWEEGPLGGVVFHMELALPETVLWARATDSQQE